MPAARHARQSARAHNAPTPPADSLVSEPDVICAPGLRTGTIAADDASNDAAVTVHTMGVHYRWQLPEVLRAQLRLAHDLREDLVTLQLAYEEDLRAIWSSYPAVAAAEADLQRAEEAAAAAGEQVKAERVRLRSNKVSPELTAQHAAARAAVKAARQARREAIAQVRDAAAQRRRDRTAKLLAEQKLLYRRYCQDDDLYWSTFNDVFRHHKTAVQRIRRQRLEGKPATLRHHRFDGTGTIAVQLQRTAAMPARSPQLLSDPAGRYHNFLVLPWIDADHWRAMSRSKQRRASRVTVRMRAGSLDGAPQWIDIPVQAHRWLPVNAEILYARLTVSRIAARFSARLTITARIQPPATAHGPTVAVHLGWRDSDRGTRVATWRSTQPLDIPDELSAVMAANADGLTGSIIVPQVISRRLERHAATAAARDASLNALREKLTSWVQEHGPVPHRDIHISADELRRWRSPARFAAVAIAWRDDPPPGDIAAVLEAWRRADRRLWDGQEHGRRRALGHRDDLYRQVGALLAGQAGRVVIDDINIAAIARSVRTREAMPANLQQIIDRRRYHAAPGKLRDAIAAAARRNGVQADIVAAKGLSRTHAGCGHQNPADDRYALPPVICEGCHEAYDPDESATLLMLRSAGVL